MEVSNLSDMELVEYYNMFKDGINKTTRFEARKSHNADLKFLYHVVRLLDECEQILTEADLDLRRSKEHLKAIRRGEISEEEIRLWFSAKEKQLEQVYTDSKLSWGPDEEKIKKLLVDCLEHHYGSLSGCLVMPNIATLALREIRDILDKYEKSLCSQ